MAKRTKKTAKTKKAAKKPAKTKLRIAGLDLRSPAEMYLNRANRVLPTRGRGDATMVTELRSDINSPDAARASAQLGKRLARDLADVLFKFRRDQFDQPDAVEFAPDLAEPVAHIAAQHE